MLSVRILSRKRFLTKKGGIFVCELFGISATRQYDITSYLKEFFGHSSIHCHGWGTAFFDRGDVQIEKETVQASKSEKIKKLLSNPVQTDRMFAHIRYATIGNVDIENCHPYSGKSAYGRTFTLIHNGTIWDYPPLEKYIHYQKGETDSERREAWQGTHCKRTFRFIRLLNCTNGKRK